MTAKTIDDYLAPLPADQRAALEALRRQILAAAPGAEECISYGMPGFRRHGVLVWMGAAKKHCVPPEADGIQSHGQCVGTGAGYLLRRRSTRATAAESTTTQKATYFHVGTAIPCCHRYRLVVIHNRR